MTDVWLLESPIVAIEGESLVFNVTMLGASSVSSPTAFVYFNGTDVTSAAMPSGSHSVSGNVITLKALSVLAAYAGGELVVVPQATVDGNTELRKFMVSVLRASDTQ